MGNTTPKRGGVVIRCWRLDCRRSFDGDDAETRYEPHPYGDSVAYERYSVCPYCGSAEWIEAFDAGKPFEELMQDANVTR